MVTQEAFSSSLTVNYEQMLPGFFKAIYPNSKNVGPSKTDTI